MKKLFLALCLVVANVVSVGAQEITSADIEALYNRVMTDKHLTDVTEGVRTWKPRTEYPGAECLNFANWAFHELHGRMAGSRDGTSHNLMRNNGVTVVFRFPEKDKLDDLELALQTGRIHSGDFIQWSRNSDGFSHHSAIYGDYDAVNHKIRILDSNRSKVWNQVKYEWMPIKTFKYRCERGVAFYSVKLKKQ